MTINELKGIIDKSPKGNEEFSLYAVEKLYRKVRMSVAMDCDSQEYSYQITENDMKKSSLNEDEVKSMLVMGWRLNEDKNIFYRKL